MSPNLKLALMAGLCSVAIGPACAGSLSDMLKVPTARTKAAIESLQTKDSDAVTKDSDAVNVKGLTVDSKKLPPSTATQTPVDAQGKSNVPFVAQNSMILQFQPDVTPDQVNDYIKSNKFEVVKTFPSIGAVQVRADLSRFFQPKMTDKSPNDTVLRGVLEASKEFKTDPRIREATPDLVLRGQSSDITNFMVATNVMGKVDTKVTDWGITDIQADQLWSEDGATDGVIFGIMDVGFAKHEDLVFLDYL